MSKIPNCLNLVFYYTRVQCAPFDAGLQYIDIITITETLLRPYDTAAYIAEISPSCAIFIIDLVRLEFFIGSFKVISHLIPYLSSLKCMESDISDSSVVCTRP